eukprot:15464183-Alexandrium_andersonii.AAC.1
MPRGPPVEQQQHCVSPLKRHFPLPQKTADRQQEAGAAQFATKQRSPARKKGHTGQGAGPSSP